MSLEQPFRHALPVNERLFQKEFYLTHAGWEIINPGEPYPRLDAPMFYFQWKEGRTLAEFCLALVVAGGGIVETRFHRSRVDAGTAFFFQPGEWHRHRPERDTGWTLLWLHFNGDAPLGWMRDGAFLLRNNRLAIENMPLFQAQFEYLLEVVHRNPACNLLQLSRQALGLISHFVQEPPSEVEGSLREIDDREVRRAVEYIWNYSHGIVDVPAVAEHAGLARRTLDRRFRVALGRSVLEEIQFCRVSRAAKLLQETTIPIKHVVHRAGFRSEEHLRLAFHKAFGVSPQEYRRKALGS